MSGRGVLHYVPPGPVGAAYFQDRAEVSVIMGPIGSGKTRASVAKILAIAAQQQPSPVDQTRYTRFVVVRRTYRQIQRSVLKTWFKQVPREFGKFNDGGGNAPSTHHLRFKLRDQTVVDCEVIFAAIGDQDVEEFCRGFEVTGAYINEMDTLAEEVLEYMPDRCGRYPDIDPHGGPTWHGVIADMNAPQVDSWAYRDFLETLRPGYRLFVQPGGRDPKAENLPNLPPGYYERAARRAKWYVHRMVDNKPGYSRDGKPVYEDFNDHLHVAGYELEAVPGVPLVIGADAGLTPAAVVCQRLPTGQWRVLDELPMDGGAGKFSDALNELLATRYPGFTVQGWCDPAAAAKSAASESEERSWLDIVKARTKLAWKTAPSNALTVRLEAVDQPLRRLIDGQPGILLSPRCKVVRAGFNNGYRYKKIRTPDGARFTDEPDKNEYSHPHDALQYALLGGTGLAAIKGRQDRHEQDQATRPVVADNDYDPFA